MGAGADAELVDVHRALAAARRAAIRATGPDELASGVTEALAARFPGARIAWSSAAPSEAGAVPIGTRGAIAFAAAPPSPTELALLVELAGDLDVRAAELAERAACREAEGRAEAELDLLHVALDNIGEQLFLSDGESPAFRYVNAAAAESLGYTVEELTGGMTIMDIDPSMTPEAWQALVGMMRVRRKGVVESTHRRRDGTIYPIEAAGTYFERHGRIYNMAVVHDLRARKAAARALEESVAAYRSLVENAPDIIVRFDRDGGLRFANGALGRLSERWPTAAGDLLARLREELPRLGATVVEVPLELTVSGERLDFDARLVPEKATDTILAIARDVSAQHRLEAQFLQAQKMEAVGRLAGGIAHDFNNMLAVIQMQTSLLHDERDPLELHEGLLEIASAAERAGRLTRQLLAFSRRQVKRAVDLDLRQSVTGLSRLLQRVLGEDIELVTVLGPAPRVQADEGMIEQVLMNLGVNARDAMPDGGRLTIALDRADVDGERPGRSAGRYARIAVTDTGSGIAPDVLPRIFEPFFTTKEAGKGTGLGLATVLSIVEQHDGFVEVASEVGRGTTLEIYLPAHAGEAAAASAGDPRPTPSGNETILLVEDDPSVRASARAVLGRLGYRVLEADGAEAAIDQWERNGRAIRLLLTDVIMPETSGRDLAATLRRDAPALPVLFASGYSADFVASSVALDGRTHLIGKPFDVAELATAVRRAIDGVPPPTRA